MSTIPFSILPEQAGHAADIEKLIQEVFGPGMTARAAYALREGVEHTRKLSFIASADERLIGTVRLTRILWGGEPALMLGPLAVLPQENNKGIGSALMHHAIDAASQAAQRGGDPLIMLVGDLDYYAPFGFKPVPPNQISLPRPVDPKRVLACELMEGSLASYRGKAASFNR